MTFYTQNLCPNPAFQQGLTGYDETGDAVIKLDKSLRLYGPASLLVICPGTQAMEGVSTAAGTIPYDCTGSASVFIQGSGNVTVYAVAQPGSDVLASVSVALTGTWTRIVLSGLPLIAGQSLNLVIQTTYVEQSVFWVNGIQIETNPTAHQYCDGDQPGCFWVTGQYGISQQNYANPVAVVSSESTDSPVVNVISGNPVFITATSGESTYSPVVTSGSAGPAGAVTDFSVALLTDPDPALTYVSWNNAGQTTPASGYSRSYAVFVPPQDYMVSNGQFLYNRAAYAAIGWDFATAAQNNSVLLSRVQAEVLPMTTGYAAQSPTGFDPPRAIHSVIVANRVNFVTNPSFEVSTANWSPVGTGVLAQDSTVSVGQIARYDDTIITTGTYSCKVTVNANDDGLQTTVGSLIPGYNYIASAYVQADVGLANILMTAGSGSTSVLASSGTGYNFGAYNAGPYGGFNPTVNLPTGTWYRIWTVFTATADSHVLSILASAATGATYPTHIWADGILVEQGEVLNGYFDGASGKNYTWDSKSGTPGLARSYFYDQMAVKQQAVLNVLGRHTPLGISYVTPIYSQPPIQ